MSLLTICQDALNSIGGFNVPASFYSNTDLTAKQCVALVNEAGKDLEKGDRWSELITEGTITTVSGTATYAKPTDFRAFGNMSQWDRTNQWRMTGPVPSMVWQWLQSGLVVASATNRWFMVRGAYITIYPTPTVSGDTLAYDYYSKNWLTVQSTGATAARWAADLDTALLDEDLLTADLKWRFLQAKGMPYQPEYARWESLKESLLSDNGGRGIIDLGAGAPNDLGMTGGNLPDTGFGQ